MKYYSNNLSSSVKVGDTIIHFGKRLEVVQTVGNPMEEVCAFDVFTDKEYVFTHIRQCNRGLVAIEDLSRLFLPVQELSAPKVIIVFRYPHTSLGANVTQPEAYQASSSNTSDDKAHHDYDGYYDGEITPPDLEMWRWHQ